MPYNSIRLELEQAIACGDSQILKPHPGVYVMRANAGTADLLEACGKRQNRPVWGYALQVGRRNHRGGHSESGRRLPIRENLSRCLHPPAECQPCTAPGCEDIASRLVPEHSLGLITCYGQRWNRHGVNWMQAPKSWGARLKVAQRSISPNRSVSTRSTWEMEPLSAMITPGNELRVNASLNTPRTAWTGSSKSSLSSVFVLYLRMAPLGLCRRKPTS